MPAIFSKRSVKNKICSNGKNQISKNTEKRLEGLPQKNKYSGNGQLSLSPRPEEMKKNVKYDIWTQEGKEGYSLFIIIIIFFISGHN